MSQLMSTRGTAIRQQRAPPGRLFSLDEHYVADWYTIKSLVGTGKIDKGAIISIAGDSAWATTAGFTVRDTGYHATLSHHVITAREAGNKLQEGQAADKDLHRNQQIAADEMKNIAAIVTGDQAAIDKAYAEGLHVAGERFVLTKTDEGSLYARKVRDKFIFIPSLGTCAGQ